MFYKKGAIVDREKLGIHLVAFATINLREASRPRLEKFEADIRELNEVVECYTMTSAWD